MSDTTQKTPVPPASNPTTASAKPTVFDGGTAQRVLETTRYVERFVRGTGRHGGPAPRGGLTPGYVAIASGSVTARSGTTAGTGSATLYTIDPSTGVISSVSETVTVKNILNKTAASGAYLGLLWTGVWTVVAVGDCANLS